MNPLFLALTGIMLWMTVFSLSRAGGTIWFLGFLIAFFCFLYLSFREG